VELLSGEVTLNYLDIYLPNILAALAAAVALAILGSMLAARSESLQAFVASQSAALGITIGLLVLIFTVGMEHGMIMLPTIFAFIFSVSVYLVTQKLCERHRVVATEILVAAFLLIIAINYLFTAAIPSLEQHFSIAFMGDIATASGASSYWLFAVSLLSVFFFILNYRRLVFQSFWIASSGIVMFPVLKLCFYLVASLLIVESTRLFGFLFTSASLLCLPLGASIGTKSLKGFSLSLPLLAIVSTSLGFGLSLKFQNLSTSATIVVMQVLVSALFVFKNNLRS